MTNPTSYTDEQVLVRAQIVWDTGHNDTSEMLRSLLAGRQRLQADCITYWNHVAELQAKVAGLQAEVEALRPDAERYRWIRNTEAFDVVEDAVLVRGAEYGIELRLGESLDMSIDTARATPNETKETGHGNDA